MTSFVPSFPRRKWHPSQWNLVRVGSALGVTLALGACQDETVTPPDEAADTEDVSEYSEYSDWSEVSEYTDYSEYSDWSEYSEYTDYSEYSDWSDNAESYAECYGDEDCGPGMACVYNYCSPIGDCVTSSDCLFNQFCDESSECVVVNLPAQCLAPALQEIPLPDDAGGVVVALRFVDVDDDPAEELVLLRSDALVVIDGDQTLTVPHGAYALDGIAATDVDGDGMVDLVGTSSTKLNSRVFFADGLGGFVDSGTGPGMRLAGVHGIDWPIEGTGELLALNQASEAVLLSDLAQLMPTIETVGVGTVSAAITGHFDGDTLPDLALLESCIPLIQTQSGGGYATDSIGPIGSCGLAVGDFDAAGIDDLALVRADDSFSVVSMYTGQSSSFVVGLVGAYQVAQPTRFGGATRAMLVQTGPVVAYMFADPVDETWCRGVLDELPPTSQFAVGDFDGDGIPELATIEVGGGARLWSDD